MITPVLKKLGLSDKAGMVYTTLLSLGSASVRQIADGAGVNRGTTYDILKSLLSDGLVSYVNKDAKNYFIAEDPTHLRVLIKKQQGYLREVEAELESQVPELQSLFSRHGEKPVVRYFEGDRGIRTLLTDVLSTMEKQKDKLYHVYSSSTISEHYNRAFPKYTEARIARGVHVQVMATGPGGSPRGLDERKWLTKEEGSPAYTFIYAGHLAHIALDAGGQMVGVIIENKAMYEAQRLLFQALWKRL